MTSPWPMCGPPNHDAQEKADRAYRLAHPEDDTAALRGEIVTLRARVKALESRLATYER